MLTITDRQPLRDYQRAAVDDVRDALTGAQRVVLQLATGAGKTRIASEICRLALSKGSRVLFLAPRRELIYQAGDALAMQGMQPGTIMAGEVMQRHRELQVASFDTLHARAIQTRRMQMPPADLVIVDEAHLSVAQSRKEIIRHYARARVVGLTATPARGDGRGLGEIYQAMVHGPSINDLVEQGHLVPLRYYSPSEPDLAAVALDRSGDYQERQLGGRMNTPALIGDIVQHWQRLASDRRTVVFCVDCAHSRAVRDEFLAAGVRAEHVDGETPLDERAAIFGRVRSGETQVLTNVFVASYGLDIPELDCAVLARPTRNIALYLQTVGRVMRTAPGKRDALIIDHAGAVRENGFAADDVPWTLDANIKIREAREVAKQEKKEPKEITCSNCQYVFRAARACPSCGHEMIKRGDPVPVHEAELVEVTPAQVNKAVSWDDKLRFIGGLRAVAAIKGHSPGWVSHNYRDKFGVWPNDPRLRVAPAGLVTEDVARWLQHRRIAWAKRRDQ